MIKEEFGLGEVLKSKEQAYRLMEEAVEIYNNYSPHLSLKMRTPNEVHKMVLFTGEQENQNHRQAKLLFENVKGKMNG